MLRKGCHTSTLWISVLDTVQSQGKEVKFCDGHTLCPSLIVESMDFCDEYKFLSCSKSGTLKKFSQCAKIPHAFPPEFQAIKRREKGSGVSSSEIEFFSGTK